MKRVIIFSAFVIMIFTGCKKDPVEVSAAGVRAFLTVQHHSVAIPHARVFIKYGTLVFPGTDTTLYDQRIVTDSNGKFTLNNLPNGQEAYTFYAKGIDPSWDTTHVTPVWGYQFLTTDTHNGEYKDYTVNIPVSE